MNEGLFSTLSGQTAIDRPAGTGGFFHDRIGKACHTGQKGGHVP